MAGAFERCCAEQRREFGPGGAVHKMSLDAVGLSAAEGVPSGLHRFSAERLVVVRQRLIFANF